MKTATGKTVAVPPATSDAAVQTKTGKTWPQWFAILDRAGCARKTHKEIVALLDQQHQLDGWWCQMVTVTYEQARGLRDKHQKPDGYSVSVSRVINAPIALIYQAWTDTRQRRRWLEAALTIRKATENKSLRITWENDQTSVTVNFYDKGAAKAQVVAQHEKLPDAKAAAQMKAYWNEALDRLKAMLEN